MNDETMQPGPPHTCPWVRRAERAEEEMGSSSSARIDEVLDLLRSISDRVVRIETLVDRDLGKEGTLEKLGDKVEGMNTRILLFSGGVTAAFNALRYLLPILK